MEIKMKISLDPNAQERIYVPFLEITYREKATNLIHSETRAQVSFIMDYYQNME